tara:strand:- start:1180 stop:1599 length:420 start_codon:yes stop_codon:yes gene_type:complete
MKTLFLFLSIIAFSFPEDSIAEAVTYNELTNQVKNIIIESDRQVSDNSNDVFSAIGKVKINYPLRGIIATSDEAKYLRTERKIILIGDVEVIQQGFNSISAEEVIFFLDDNRILANSNSDDQVLTKFILNSDLQDKVFY